MGKEDINHRAVAAVLEVLHVNKDLNKTGFANLLGIRPSTFTEILKGRMNASSELMEVLVSNYGISATWILTGEGDMFTTNQEVELNKSSEDALTCNLLDLIRQKDEIIRQQAKEIGRLEQALEDAQRKKGSHAYDAHTEAIADAG